MKNTINLSLGMLVVFVLTIAIAYVVSKNYSRQAVVNPPPSQTVIPDKPPKPVAIPEPKTYADAVLLCKEHRRNLFLVFSADWCPHCVTMKRNVWPNPTVKEALKGYVVYSVDVDRERSVANTYGVRAIPLYGIYDVTTDVPKAVKTGSGGRTVDQFLEWLGTQEE